MAEYFVVYNVTVYGKRYLIVLDDSYVKWNEYHDKATLMEKPVAALWVNVLQMKEPLSTFGMESA